MFALEVREHNLSREQRKGEHTKCHQARTICLLSDTKDLLSFTALIQSGSYPTEIINTDNRYFMPFCPRYNFYFLIGNTFAEFKT